MNPKLSGALCEYVEVSVHEISQRERTYVLHHERRLVLGNTDKELRSSP